MELMLAVRLVVFAFVGLLPFFLTLFALAAGVVALAVYLYHKGVEGCVHVHGV